ncbi:MAG TPA: GNAT family N-acetyltransferase [Polyangiaceae bacterium]
MPTVEALDPSLANVAAGVLARAFRDNPGMVAVLPDLTDSDRLGLLEPCMLGFVKSMFRYGTVEVVKEGGAIVAVALAFRPGEFPPPFFATIVQAGGPIRAGLGAALRFARIDHEMRKRHPHYPHFYLWFLGVEPARQGQGLGSLLLRSLSGKAEADGVPCYLETDKASSVKLYERHGYRVEAEEVLPSVEVRLWFMRRPDPRAAV